MIVRYEESLQEPFIYRCWWSQRWK